VIDSIVATCATHDNHQAFFSATSLLLLVSMAPVTVPYASYSIQRGIQTHSVLKKNRYSHVNIQLDVSRFGLPLSHSYTTSQYRNPVMTPQQHCLTGTKVIQPP
jgi:hypothetical protein